MSIEQGTFQKESGTFRLQQYVDPLFGSERYVSFNADSVAEATEGSKWLIGRPRAPVTYVRFKTGESFTVSGHWAEAIRAAQG